MRDAFLHTISAAASAALASQVPALLQQLQQLLLQSTTALLHATQQQYQQGRGLTTLVINAVAMQLMMASFLSGVQQQPQQQQELLLLHLLHAVPEATAALLDLQPLHKQLLLQVVPSVERLSRKKGDADAATAWQQEQQLAVLLHLLGRGQDSLRLSICMLLRHIRSFAAPFAVAAKLLPAASQAYASRAPPDRADASALSAAVCSVAESTHLMQRMQQQQQQQPQLPPTDDTAEAENQQQQALLLLHQQQQKLQMQQSRALQHLEYLLLLDMLQEDGGSTEERQRRQQRQQQQQQQQQPKASGSNGGEANASAGYKAAVLLLLLLQEMGLQPNNKILMTRVLLQLHRVCSCTERRSEMAAAQEHWLLPHLPLLFRLLSCNAAEPGASFPQCDDCGESLPSCILSSAARLCLRDPLPAASAAAAAANSAAAAATAATAKANEMVGGWALSPDLLEERAFYPVLMQRCAALLRKAASAVCTPGTTAAAGGEVPAAKKRRKLGHSEHAGCTMPEGTAACNRKQISAAASLQHVSLGLCMQLPAEVFAASSPADASLVAAALWEALQAATKALQDLPACCPADEQQLLVAAITSTTRALRHLCCCGAPETAALWAAACIPKGRGLRAVLAPLAAATGSNKGHSVDAAAAVAAAEAISDVLWTASAAETAAHVKGAAAVVAAAADLLLVEDLVLKEEEEEAGQRQQLQKQMKGALRNKDATAIVFCCSQAAKAFASCVAKAVENPDEGRTHHGLLLLSLAAFKALHALALPWVQPYLLQNRGQKEHDQQQEELLQEMTEALPANSTQALMALLAATVATALDEQLTAISLLSSPAAAAAAAAEADAAADASYTPAHLAACALDLLRQHQVLGSWLLQRRADAAAEAALKEAAATDGAEESNEQQQQQQKQRERMQRQRREADRISGIAVSRCSVRTPEAFSLSHQAGLAASPQQLLRLLRRLQRVVLSGDPQEEATAGTAEGRLRLRGSGMRLLMLLCSHWSGAMKHLPLIARHPQEENEYQQQGTQQRQRGGPLEHCRSVTAKLVNLLLEATKRELQLHASAAVAGATDAVHQPQGEGLAFQGQTSDELQHLLAVALQQEQQKESLEITATYFPVDAYVTRLSCGVQTSVRVHPTRLCGIRWQFSLRLWLMLPSLSAACGVCCRCWGSFAVGLPGGLLSHAVAHLGFALEEALDAFNQQQMQQEAQEETGGLQLEDAVLTAAACAQALWGISLQRSELTRCLRREGGGGLLQQTLLVAAQLLLQLLQAAHAYEKCLYSCDGGLHVYEQQSSLRSHCAREALQRRLLQVACMHAWCSARTAQFLGEVFRCCALVAASRTADRGNAHTQITANRPHLEDVADVMMDFARGLVEQAEDNSRAAKASPHILQVEAQQLHRSPLACLTGRAALRGASVLLTTLWRSHEFSPLQRQQQALLMVLLRLLRLLPGLQHRR